MCSCLRKHIALLWLYERHCVSNDLKHEYLQHSVCGLTARKTSKLRIVDPLREDKIVARRYLPQKGQPLCAMAKKTAKPRIAGLLHENKIDCHNKLCALLVLCGRNPPVIGGSPHKGPQKRKPFPSSYILSIPRLHAVSLFSKCGMWKTNRCRYKPQSAWDLLALCGTWPAYV